MINQSYFVVLARRDAKGSPLIRIVRASSMLAAEEKALDEADDLERESRTKWGVQEIRELA